MAANSSSLDMVLFEGESIMLAEWPFAEVTGDELRASDTFKRSRVEFLTGVDDLKPVLFSGLIGENDTCTSDFFSGLYVGEEAKNL